MDSGNSGSLQSSSGGDEEYDSRAADSVSAFMGGSNPPSFFDPLSGYLQLHQNSTSSLLNSNLSWPRTSDPNHISHDLVHSMLPASSAFIPSFQPTVGPDSVVVAPPQNQNQNQAVVRNPKKRSRASRRAPTTVLTTDTTNFRAMVQEFTGIPAPPFNTTSPFPRTRLDLFGSRSTSFDAAPQPPPYLRRPFAQKVQPPHPFLASSSSSLLSPAANTNNNFTQNASAASSSAPSINYQLPMTQSSNLFNIPNQNILTSLLQSNPKFPFSTSPITSSSKPQTSFQIPSNDDQFQVSGALTGLPNLIPSDQMAPRHDHDHDHDHDNSVDTSNAARWSNNNPDGDKDERGNLRALNGSYEFERNTMSGKMSFAGSSTSGFHGGKAPDTAVRGEGMVESWICSSE